MHTMDTAVKALPARQKVKIESELSLEKSINIPAQRTVYFKVSVRCGCGYDDHYFSRVVDFNSPMTDGSSLPLGDLRSSDQALTRAEYEAGLKQS